MAWLNLVNHAICRSLTEKHPSKVLLGLWIWLVKDTDAHGRTSYETWLAYALTLSVILNLSLQSFMSRV